jgi:hypothetical protein
MVMHSARRRTYRRAAGRGNEATAVAPLPRTEAPTSRYRTTSRPAQLWPTRQALSTQLERVHPERTNASRRSKRPCTPIKSP